MITVLGAGGWRLLQTISRPAPPIRRIRTTRMDYFFYNTDADAIKVPRRPRFRVLIDQGFAAVAVGDGGCKSMPFSHWARSLVVAVISAFIAMSGCGGGGPSAPTPAASTQSPTVTSVSPKTGPVGTFITIIGTNFAPGATVAVGGVTATNVQVASATTITATTGPHSAGVGDVVVTVSGRAGSLPGGFTYTVSVRPPHVSSH